MVRTKKVSSSRSSSKSFTRASAGTSSRASTRKRSAASKFSLSSTVSVDNDGFAVPAPVAPTLKSIKKDINDQFEAHMDEFKKTCDFQLNNIKKTFACTRVMLSKHLDTPIHKLFADYKPPPSATKLDHLQKTQSSVSSSVMQDRTNMQYSSKSVKSQSALKNSTLKSDSSKGSERSIFKQPVKTRNSLRIQQQQQQTVSSTNKYVTPMNTRPIPNMPAVTPKVNMNTPLSIIRRPRAGEFAMSITGSPLMVSAIPRDEIPSVCVPLPDGTIMRLSPKVTSGAISRMEIRKSLA